MTQGTGGVGGSDEEPVIVRELRARGASEISWTRDEMRAATTYAVKFLSWSKGPVSLQFDMDDYDARDPMMVATFLRKLDAALGQEPSLNEEPPWDQRAPDLFEKVIGFRFWRVEKVMGTWLLLPWGQGTPDWRGRMAVRARCARGQHHAPAKNHHCGFNLYHDVTVKSGYMNRLVSKQAVNVVYGACAAWGGMEVHRDGFRAEWVQPVALAYDPTCSEVRVLEPVEIETTSVVKRVFRRSERTVMPDDRERVTDIARGLRIPVVSISALQTFAHEHGKPIPRSLRYA